MPQPITQQEFHERYSPEPNTGCWLWLWSRNAGGYGTLHFHRRSWLAHRLMWTLVGREIPPDSCILHKCDTPSCINPDHLFLGTLADNNKDRNRKGRTGWRSKSAKLTQAQADELRQLYATGEWSQMALADKFDLAQSAVSSLILGHTYNGAPRTHTLR